MTPTAALLGTAADVFLGLLLGLAVWWAARDPGRAAGTVALVVYLSTPDFLAHGQLVTTDLAGAVHIPVGLFLLSGTEGLTVFSGLGTCLSVGFALASKLTGVLVLPMLALTGVAFALSSSPMTAGRREVVTRGRRLLIARGLLVAVAIGGCIILWMCYGFRYRIAPPTESVSWIDWSFFWARSGAVNRLMRVLHPLHSCQPAMSSAYSMRRHGNGPPSCSGGMARLVVLLHRHVSRQSTIPSSGSAEWGSDRRYGAGFPSRQCCSCRSSSMGWLRCRAVPQQSHRHLLPIYRSSGLAARLGQVSDAAGCLPHSRTVDGLESARDGSRLPALPLLFQPDRRRPGWRV